MRYAFSTLGVPGLPVPEVVRLAAAHGYHGVELRAHPEEPVHPGIDARQRADVAKQFAAGGVRVLTVAGYARVADPDDAERLDALVDLAYDLGASYVRVFPGGRGSPEDDGVAVRRLRSVAALAADRGVRVLLETHDSHRTGAAVARVLDRVGAPSVGALWDVMHTWLGGESPAESYTALAPHLGYVQVKDITSAQDTTPLPLGAGVLPLADALAPLGPDGWLCWEYEKRWYPEAAELPGLLTAGRERLAALLAETRTPPHPTPWPRPPGSVPISRSGP
ncbi:sugar phosphate isomerase/epimerase family protein [Streptomyces melanogenes]|uniref:sugar phosphate isomerase/epimerase family protein n=1 Tax=Streptomyces melanogenes TaxID=67326 RepID=UPI00167DFCF8|nr:sugar phosphate isomerase/epimerase family protein [Streptomyces melanogenes]